MAGRFISGKFGMSIEVQSLGRVSSDESVQSRNARSIPREKAFLAEGSMLLAYNLLGQVEVDDGNGSTTTKAWPTRSELEAGVRLVSQAASADFAPLDNAERASAVTVIVELLLPTFESTYGASLPNAAAPTTEIDAFIADLWLRKYGEAIDAQNQTTARSRFRALARETFIAYFILDVGNISTPSGAVITPTLGFKSPPNDNFLEWSDSAILLGLLRSSASEYALHEAANDPEDLILDVVGLSSLLPADRGYQILDNAAYAARFEVADIQLVHFVDDWKESSWFGVFYDDPSSGWNFHSDIGWLWYEMEDQRENHLWYFDQTMGWLWTSSTSNPFVFSSSTGSWFYRFPQPLSESEGLRWFYDLENSAWISN
jgi:hypothetical protein|tara:strand:- start:1439 stop:2557 length:1119 start_codon:yes stop_codon:yes gene_type:complete